MSDVKEKATLQSGFGSVGLVCTTDVANNSRIDQLIATDSDCPYVSPQPREAQSSEPAGGEYGSHVNEQNIKRAPSNSTLPRIFRADLDLFVCIDRISFVAKVLPEDVPALQRYIAFSPSISNDRKSNTFGYRNTYTLANVGVLEVGDRASGAIKTDGVKIRCDFNPQNMPLEVLVGLSTAFKAFSLQYTRVDVAIDYKLDLVDSSAYHKELQLIASYGVGKNNTGWTFGSRKGKRYIRVYDKRKERQQAGFENDSIFNELADDCPLWRIEAESRPRGSEILPESLFDGLQVCCLDSSADKLPWQTLAVVRQCLAEPTFIRKIPTENGRRKKYLELIAEVTNELNPAPRDVYLALLPELRYQLLTFEMLMAGWELAEYDDSNGCSTDDCPS